jgi:hypothetical protein
MRFTIGGIVQEKLDALRGTPAGALHGAQRLATMPA